MSPRVYELLGIYGIKDGTAPDSIDFGGTKIRRYELQNGEVILDETDFWLTLGCYDSKYVIMGEIGQPETLAVTLFLDWEGQPRCGFDLQTAIAVLAGFCLTQRRYETKWAIACQLLDMLKALPCTHA